MTTPEPLDLVDVDGDRIRFECSLDASRLWVHLGGNDPEAAWSLEAVLTPSDALQLLGWLGHAFDVEPCHLPTCQHLADRARA